MQCIFRPGIVLDKTLGDEQSAKESLSLDPEVEQVEVKPILKQNENLNVFEITFITYWYTYNDNTGCFTHLDPFEMQNFRSKNFKIFSN